MFVCFFREASAQWVQTNGPHRGAIHAFVIYDSMLYAGTDSEGVFWTNDSGGHWMNTSIQDTSHRNSYIDAFMVNGGRLYAGSAAPLNGGNIYRTADSGASWSSALLPHSVVTSVYALATSGGHLFGAVDNFGPPDNGVIVSTDSGATWVTAVSIWCNAFVVTDTNIFANSVGGNDSGGVWRAKSDSGISGGWEHWKNEFDNSEWNCLIAAGGNLFVGRYDYIYISTDNGVQWSLTNEGNPQIPHGHIIYSLASFDNIVFAATDSSILYTTNYGGQWYDVNGNLPISNTLTPLIAYNGYLYAGKDSTVWRRSISNILSAVKDQPGVSPSNFSLTQNYPNPFTASTQIDYDVSQFGAVRLDVLNALGETVATPVHAERSAGHYAAQFNGEQLPNGVYFVRLTANGAVQTRMMEVLR